MIVQLEIDKYRLDTRSPTCSWWAPRGIHLACSSSDEKQSPNAWLASLIVTRAFRNYSVVVIEPRAQLESYIAGLGVVLPAGRVSFLESTDPADYQEADAELVLLTGVDAGFLQYTDIRRFFRAHREVVIESQYRPLHFVMDEDFGPKFNTISFLAGAFSGYQGVEFARLPQTTGVHCFTYESTPLQQAEPFTDSIRVEIPGNPVKDLGIAVFCRASTPTASHVLNCQLSTDDNW